MEHPNAPGIPHETHFGPSVASICIAYPGLHKNDITAPESSNRHELEFSIPQGTQIGPVEEFLLVYPAEQIRLKLPSDPTLQDFAFASLHGVQEELSEDFPYPSRQANTIVLEHLITLLGHVVHRLLVGSK